jgi:uncharacterized membrane protein
MPSRDAFVAVDRTRAVAAIVLGGAALRLFALGKESFWMDELYSITDALRFTTVELITVLPVVKTHTPAYYVLLRYWIRITEIAEATLRLPSVVAGVATVYAVYLVGARLFDWRRGALAAGMVALSRFHIDHSQQVRMYAFVALLTALSFYWLVGLNETYTRGAVAGYVLATALLVYTHPYGVFVVLAGNLYVWSRLAASADLGHGVGRWVAVQTGLGALLLPYGVVLLEKLRSTAGGTYTPIGWRTPPEIATVAGTPVRHMGYPIHPVTLAIGVPLVVGLLGVAAFRVSEGASDSIGRQLSVRGDDREAVLLSAYWLAVPVLVPAVLSHLLTPIYGVRYTIGASLALFLLLAHGLTRIERRHVRYAVAGVLLVWLIVPVPVHYAVPTNEQWREATSYVTENADDDDLVVFADADTTNAWTVYAPDADLAVREVDSDQRWQILNETVRERDTVWVLNRTFAQSTEHRSAKAVLSDTHRLADEQTYYGVEVYRFERRENAR